MLWTIGHSNQPIDRFIGLLALYGIEDVYDVRSKPYSRFNPQFGRDRLQTALRHAGIGYVYMGHALGGHPEDPCCYQNGKLSYALQARTPMFRSGLEILRSDAATKDIAIMCAEKDPLQCHRFHSICANLDDMEINHILHNGQMISQRELLLPQETPQKVFAF
ncbi:MAG TPA: DUF488 domain-containing protein [Alphaproteobacteria bacterium]